MVVFAGSWRSTVMADCIRYGARKVELICSMDCGAAATPIDRSDGTLGKKSGFAITYCCWFAPLKRVAANVLASAKRS